LKHADKDDEWHHISKTKYKGIGWASIARHELEQQKKNMDIKSYKQDDVDTNSQGRYQISTQGGTPGKGTTLGTYNIAFNKIVPDGKVPTAEEQEAPNFNPARFPGLEKTKDLVPSKYRTPKTSGFQITVEKGKNEHNFELLSK
jgi:hypothetical protein